MTINVALSNPVRSSSANTFLNVSGVIGNPVAGFMIHLRISSDLKSTAPASITIMRCISVGMKEERASFFFPSLPPPPALNGLKSN